MTRDQLYELTNSILNDTIGDNIFNALLDTAQAYLEQQRPWAILRKIDDSQTIQAGTTINTEYNLPEDFNRWYDEYPVQLGLGSVPQTAYLLKEVPEARKFVAQYDPFRFFVNYRTGKLHFCGAQTTGYTIYQFYIYNPPSISENSVVDGEVVYPNEWVFPERFQKILAWICAAFYRNGVDYDPLNAQQGNEDEKIMLRMWDAMTKWDDELLAGMVYGLNEPGPNSAYYPGYGNPSGNGFVDLNG